jgi:hypothetical protein
MEKKTLKDFVGQTLKTRSADEVFIIGINPYEHDQGVNTVVVANKAGIIYSVGLNGKNKTAYGFKWRYANV